MRKNNQDSVVENIEHFLNSKKKFWWIIVRGKDRIKEYIFG